MRLSFSSHSNYMTAEEERRKIILQNQQWLQDVSGFKVRTSKHGYTHLKWTIRRKRLGMVWFPAQWMHIWLSGQDEVHSACGYILHSLQTHLQLFLLGKQLQNRALKYPTVLTFTSHISNAWACLKVTHTLCFSISSSLERQMKAVAKEHSDVTERLQTQTVNSTLWVARHHHQLPRESCNTWLSPPPVQLPTDTTANHAATHSTPASHSIPVMYRLVWRRTALSGD